MSVLSRSWMSVRDASILWRALIYSLPFILILVSAGQWEPAAYAIEATNDPISAAEFSRIVQDFSEDSGSYRGDSNNFTSNERGYAAAVDEMQKIPISGDAYIGVGPEQNYSYIARLRPRIAFIIDIRRQAIMQHLMYKAIFHMAEDRPAFLELLLSRPLVGIDIPGHGASVQQLTAYFINAKADNGIFEANLQKIVKMICEVFQVSLSSRDKETIRHIYAAFKKRGLRIAFSSHPTLKELIELKGPGGIEASFLATPEDYEFVRDLQLRNRVIPVVGDFAGSKAIKSIADYLSERSYSVAILYTSNVEENLDLDGKFRRYAANIRKLPITTGSYILRWPTDAGSRAMLFQQMTLFFKRYEQSTIYQDYGRLLNADGILVKTR